MARSFVTANGDFLEQLSAVLTAAPLTMACWFQQSAAHADGLVGVLSLATADDGFFLACSSSRRVTAIARQSGAQGTATATGTVTANTWTHACAVFTSGTSRAAYRDGTGKATNATDLAPASLDTTYLAAEQFGSTTLGGKLAEAGVWDAALTDAEVAVLALGTSPLLVRPASLVAYWPLWGRYDPETDIVGGFNLTVYGAAQADHCRVLMPARRRKIFLPQAAAGGGNTDFTASGGSFALTGADATLAAARTLTLAAGSYALTGSDAAVTAARALTASAGAFVLTGADATVTAARTLTLDAGSFALTGADVTLSFGHALALGAGSFILTGADVALTAPTRALSSAHLAGSSAQPATASSLRGSAPVARLRGSSAAAATTPPHLEGSV